MKYDNCNKLFVFLTISSLLLLGSVSNTVLADNYYVDCALGADDPSNGELPGICGKEGVDRSKNLRKFGGRPSLSS